MKPNKDAYVLKENPIAIVICLLFALMETGLMITDGFSWKMCAGLLLFGGGGLVLLWLYLKKPDWMAVGVKGISVSQRGSNTKLYKWDRIRQYSISWDFPSRPHLLGKKYLVLTFTNGSRCEIDLSNYRYSKRRLLSAIRHYGKNYPIQFDEQMNRKNLYRKISYVLFILLISLALILGLHLCSQ